MKKLLASALAALLFLPASIASQSSDKQSGTVERDFAAGGTVQLDLSAGDYVIEGTTADRVRVTWHTQTADDARDVKVNARVRGSEATITTDGPGNHFRVAIEVPRRSDLYLRMSAGDLDIIGIEGNKDVRLRAGDLSIEVGDPESYGQVTASVTAGDISASPFGVNTGGLFRSFSREGKGRFNLRAKLWAGDLRLIPTGAEREK
jgi:hypothetical protein